jgi:hypothetical protein
VDYQLLCHLMADQFVHHLAEVLLPPVHRQRIEASEELFGLTVVAYQRVHDVVLSVGHGHG